MEYIWIDYKTHRAWNCQNIYSSCTFSITVKQEKCKIKPRPDSTTTCQGYRTVEYSCHPVTHMFKETLIIRPPLDLHKGIIGQNKENKQVRYITEFVSGKGK